jgi:hypothetical protein
MTDVMDVRIRERYLRKGTISTADVEKYLKDLPDVTTNAEMIDYMKMFEDEQAADEDEDEDEEEDEEEEEEEEEAAAPSPSPSES